MRWYRVDRCLVPRRIDERLTTSVRTGHSYAYVTETLPQVFDCRQRHWRATIRRGRWWFWCSEPVDEP